MILLLENTWNLKKKNLNSNIIIWQQKLDFLDTALKKDLFIG